MCGELPPTEVHIALTRHSVIAAAMLLCAALAWGSDEPQVGPPQVLADDGGYESCRFLGADAPGGPALIVGRLNAPAFAREIVRLPLDGGEAEVLALGRDPDVRSSMLAWVGTEPGEEGIWLRDLATDAAPQHLHEGLELLRDFEDHGALPEAAKGDVIVHGGGNTAMDICRIMKRAGAKSVTLITASGLPGPDTAPDDLINVVPRELEEALEEGIEVIDHATVSRLIMKGSRVTGVEIIALKKEPGKDGRKRRVEFEGTERVVSVDMVVPCVGEQVDPEGYEGLLDGAYFWPDNAGGRVAERVYALGDARGNRGTVSAAIGDGRKAAEAVWAELRGEDDPAADDRPTMGVDGLNTAYYPGASRARVAKLPVSERTFEAEIEGSISRSEALAEAQRCLSCGNCLACDNCWTMCPDNAVIKTAELAMDGSHYVFDYDYCKGCGLCTHECPTGYIQSVPETS